MSVLCVRVCVVGQKTYFIDSRSCIPDSRSFPHKYKIMLRSLLTVNALDQIIELLFTFILIKSRSPSQHCVHQRQFWGLWEARSTPLLKSRLSHCRQSTIATSYRVAEFAMLEYTPTGTCQLPARKKDELYQTHCSIFQK